MELREWLILLGLALVTLIVIDGVRRLQRQRRVPRLDQVESGPAARDADPEAEARAAEINWELPNGGARVIRPAEDRGTQPKPKLQRQEHPGPSRVLSEFRRSRPDVGRPAADTTDECEPSVVPASATRSDARVDARVVATGDAMGDARVTDSVDGNSLDRDAPVRDSISAEMLRSNEARDPEVKLPPSRPEASAGHVGSPASEPVEDDRREPALSSLEGLEMEGLEMRAEENVELPERAEPLTADPEDHDAYADEERYRLVDLEGMGDSFKSGSKRVGSSMQRFGTSLQKSFADRREHKRSEKVRREQERAEKAAREAARRQQAEDEKAERRRLEAEAVSLADDDDPLFTPPRHHRQEAEAPIIEEPAMAESESDMDDSSPRDDVVRTHPVLEKALRHDVNAEHAREILSHADEIIVISVMSRDEEGFSGTALLDLMLACGLRYGRDMGIFHRFETEDPDSRLQFSMVNVVKPGTFPIEAMDDFRTQGITLLMPLPGASDTAAAFEAMVETAMVIVRHLGGVLKDEHQSVMTAQTVEFARQRVQEFERRTRLKRYQVN
ncbi:cell division protein ZipA [Halomonas aquatica]|uniref:Cell division protein ZipA n=1 Tax=Halomonas aquatica TaxID=3151123 RepID=A0ABV1NDH1_9GAMM